ncbi:MAG TPA: phosphoenolpyruvate carboxykinase [Spirochaetia bacterium]|nr:phosphoenolpyruvate carboxykinase [Spirochaetia bacterium]
MENFAYSIVDRKVIIRVRRRFCETADDLLESGLFREIVRRCIRDLARRDSPLLAFFGKEVNEESSVDVLIRALSFLTRIPLDLVPNIVAEAAPFPANRTCLADFVEHLYNFWRSFERYVVCDSEGDALEKRPYRTFNETVENFSHLVRGVYRDIQENIQGVHPRIYRQVHAGAELSAIALPLDIPLPRGPYDRLRGVSVIRQILINPPLILEPPTNKRAGAFILVNENPIARVTVQASDWLCYPALVGDLLILIYFHKTFFELGFSLCNLFEIADDGDLTRPPDAVYVFGDPTNGLDGIAEMPTVFHEDAAGALFTAAVPNRKEYGYFGYLKKMVLTLHNAIKMKQGRLPFHGALLSIQLTGGQEANVLLMGDTGAGKSETIEALRGMAEARIRSLSIVADDMGSLELRDDGVMAFGTETGAFLRLDDLSPGFAFGQIDRAILMSASRTNARIVLPVTDYATVIRGVRLDCVLYANNYEEVDATHPVMERFDSARDALEVFSAGASMSKGTTTSTGLVHTYFANIFGPPQYRELHDELAGRYFSQFFDRGIFVGQLRTRLGIPGQESQGPREAAQRLLELIASGRPSRSSGNKKSGG